MIFGIRFYNANSEWRLSMSSSNSHVYRTFTLDRENNIFQKIIKIVECRSFLSFKFNYMPLFPHLCIYYYHQNLLGIIYFSFFWKLFLFFLEKYVFVAWSLQDITTLFWLGSQLDNLTRYNVSYLTFHLNVQEALSLLHLQDISLFIKL